MLIFSETSQILDSLPSPDAWWLKTETKLVEAFYRH